MADIWHDEAAGTWMLRMRSTAYGLGLAGDGTAVRHLYWGAEVPSQAVAGLLAGARGDLPRERYRSWALERPEEYVPWGGIRFDEPSLKVEYADGTRVIEWRYAGQRISRDGAAVTLEVDLADVAYDLAVTLFYRLYDGFDVLERYAWDRVAIQEGFTQAYAPSVMMAWVTDRLNFLTGRRLPMSFRFHVAMAGSLGIGADLTQWTEADQAEAAALVADYKQIRPVVQRGRLYRLASVRTGPLGASQYVARDGGEAVVLAWWGPAQCGPGRPRLRLAGLDDGARYTDPATGTEYWGAALATDGLALPGGPSDFGSTLIRLIRQ